VSAPVVARPATNPLGVAALVVAIVAVAAGIIASPFQLLLQVRGGVPFQAVVYGVAVVVVALAIVALILGIVALRRPGLSSASPGAAIGISGFLLVGQVVGVLTTLVLAAGSSFAFVS
jgi:uncharacterized BrkB/YihY/UPF0761 family membrane protein